MGFLRYINPLGLFGILKGKRITSILHLPYTCLSLAILLIGCESSRVIPTTQRKFELGDIASITFESGAANIEILEPNEKQDYILAIVSSSSKDYRTEEKLSTRIKTNVLSAPLPAQESDFLDSLPNRVRSPSDNIENDPRQFFGTFTNQSTVSCPQSKVKSSLPDTFVSKSFYVPFNAGNLDAPACAIQAIESNYPNAPNCFFKLWVDSNLMFSGSNSVREIENERLQYFQNPFFTELNRCLNDRLTPLFKALFGFPPPINNGPVTILLTQLESLWQGQIVYGLFDFTDFFKRSNFMTRFEYSNEQAMVYLDYTPGLATHTEHICKTAFHELQHLMNFYSKVLHPRHIENKLEPVQTAVPEFNKQNFQELYGINEGLSLIAESIYGSSVNYQNKFRSFLVSMDNVPLTSTRQTARASVVRDDASIGANASLIDYWLYRAGGYTLPTDINAPFGGKGLDLFQSIVTSEKYGYENLAALAKVKPETLFGDWIASLLYARFDLSLKADSPLRFPPAKYHPISGERIGVDITHQFDTRGTINEAPDRVNWHWFNIPILSETETIELNPDAIAFRRFVVAKPVPSQRVKIIIEGPPKSTLYGYVLRTH